MNSHSAHSSGAEDAYLNGRTETGVGFCPSAIGRPRPDVLISMSILTSDNMHLCSLMVVPTGTAFGYEVYVDRPLRRGYNLRLY